jgi:hypothetical protein
MNIDDLEWEHIKEIMKYLAKYADEEVSHEWNT